MGSTATGISSKRRDGEADLLNRRLANREDFFNGLEVYPVR
jgi:hypothetical protein